MTYRRSGKEEILLSLVVQEEINKMFGRQYG